MNRYLAEIIDRYALNNLHKKKSKERHFYNKIKTFPTLEDVHTYYPSPNIPNIEFDKKYKKGRYTVGRFQYESEIENGPSNIYSTGEYYECDNQSANVIIVNGWRMGNLDKVKKLFLNPLRKM
ncbi:UNVERIFIED_CONTAM: hypothetical protein Cloal_4144 [Acetivibrio alkalicellulosi]